jgi:ABC-type Mn2+/Zn2+ transport system ATPase subunit
MVLSPSSTERGGAPGDRHVTLAAERVKLGYRRRVLAEEVSFEISRGEILGIVGPNGSGKTTLLRTILGLMPPLSGRVTREPNLTVAYVPQREQLETILPITAREVVLMGRTARFGDGRRGRDDNRAAVQRALARVDAEPLAPQLFRNLSGGQQRRVVLARALVAEPDVLVLDEPTSGMDVTSEAAIVGFLRDLNRSQRITILFVTHELSLALNLATTIMLMNGRTILHGPVDEIVRADRLSALYGVRVHLGEVAGQRVLVVDQSGAPDV